MLPLDPMIIRCLRVWVGCTTSPLTLWRYHWQFSCWLYVSIWSCFTLFMRHCRERRFSSCIITRSFSCTVPIDRCHLFSVTVVNILMLQKNICWISWYWPRLALWLFVLWYCGSMHCRSENNQRIQMDWTKEWKVGNSDRILLIAECIAL